MECPTSGCGKEKIQQNIPKMRLAVAIVLKAGNICKLGLMFWPAVH